MTRDRLLRLFVDAMKKDLDGPPPMIGVNTNPIDDLGMDSLRGVEILMTLDIDDSLRDKIPLTFSPFVDRESGPEPRNRTIGEIVDCILEMVRPEEGQDNVGHTS